MFTHWVARHAFVHGSCVAQVMSRELGAWGGLGRLAPLQSFEESRISQTNLP